jgi:phosphoglycerol transferase
MKIAILNAFPNLSFSAEREFINRSVSVLSELGHSPRAVGCSDEIYRFDPDLVVLTHESVAKLTDHYTAGFLWSPATFSKNDMERLNAIRSWDLAVPINAATRTFAQDLRFSEFLRRDVSNIDFYPSCQDVDMETPDPSRLSLAYVGVHWDGDRHGNLIRALADKVDLNVYGPSNAWKHLPNNYRGTIPFDGQSLVRTLNRHGAVLAIHKEEHRAESTPSMRVFEAIAARCLVITEPLKPFVDIFGDSLIYLDHSKSSDETATEIARVLENLRKHPEEFQRRIQASHSAFRASASLEVLWRKLIDDVGARKAARRAPYAAQRNDATVSVIIRCGSRPLAMVVRAVESVTRQSYRDIGIIFARFAPIDGFDDFVSELEAGGRLSFVRVVEASGEGVRSAAMWAGLRSVETPYFALLDDDDELFETHFSDLVRILDRNPDIGLAYSGTIQCEEDDLDALEQIGDDHHLSYRIDIPLKHPRFDGDAADRIAERRVLCFDDFDLDRMLKYENLVPSNTWLARRDVLTGPVLEDPGLEVAEDLYFLLLLLTRSMFAFSGTASAISNWRSATMNNAMCFEPAQRWEQAFERIERRLAHHTLGEYPGRIVLGAGRTSAGFFPRDLVARILRRDVRWKLLELNVKYSLSIFSKSKRRKYQIKLRSYERLLQKLRLR